MLWLIRQQPCIGCQLGNPKPVVGRQAINRSAAVGGCRALANRGGRVSLAV